VIPTPDSNNKITASIDDSFVLSCVSTGSSEDRPNALKWVTPTGKVIQSDSQSRVYTVLQGDTLRLYFDKLAPSDSGTYTCEGIEAGGVKVVKADLVLQKRISFDGTVPNQLIKSGLDQNVICRASANPGPEISWFRKGINVVIKNNDKYLITNDGLMIKNAQIEDEGDYICQASVTSTGEVKRVSINVQVMSRPVWVIQPKDTEGVRGEDLIIRCEAFAKPAPKYTWARNNIPIAGPRFLINEGTLTIRNLEKEDTATYTCIAENESGTIEANLRLFVLIGPEIAIMDDITVLEGQQAMLKCNVREAFPKAQIRWKYKDTGIYITGTEIDSNFEIKTDATEAHTPITGALVGSWSELHFKRASRFDMLNYTCVASNKAAVSERTVQLLVDFAPKFILNTEAKEVYYSWIHTDEYGNSGNSAGQSVRSYPVKFMCLADGYPKPEITWYFKGIPIEVDNKKYRLLRNEGGLSQLEVNPRSLTDFGDYQCRALNRVTRQEQNIQLRQATAPKFPPLVKVKQINPEIVLLDIHPSEAPEADGGMQIEAYKIQWRLSNNDWSKPNEKEIPIDLSSIDAITNPVRDFFDVEINALLPDTDYLFRAAAVNKAGVGVWMLNEIKVRTAPRRQPNPVKVTSKEDCHASTRCQIEWTIDSNGGSPIREYLIRWRRIYYKDPSNSYVNTERVEPWSSTKRVTAPVTNYEITFLAPNSFYEVEVLARNDIGPSAGQPFRIRTLVSSPAEIDSLYIDQYVRKTGSSNSLPGYSSLATLNRISIIFNTIQIILIISMFLI